MRPSYNHTIWQCMPIISLLIPIINRMWAITPSFFLIKWRLMQLKQFPELCLYLLFWRLSPFMLSIETLVLPNSSKPRKTLLFSKRRKQTTLYHPLSMGISMMKAILNLDNLEKLLCSQNLIFKRGSSFFGLKSDIKGNTPLSSNLLTIILILCIVHILCKLLSNQ